MMLLLLFEIYTSFILFYLLSYAKSISVSLTSGIKGVVSLSPLQLPSPPPPTTTTTIATTSSSLSSSTREGYINPQATYFTGAGVYLFWQMGAAKYLQQHTCIKSEPNHPIVGASAGALTATMLIADIDFDHALSVAIRLAENAKIYERGNLIGVLGLLLRQWLDEIIPDDIDVQLLTNLYIALTPLTKSPKLVTDFKDKGDLIDALMASCHLPVLLNGHVHTTYKNERVIDGSFYYFVTKNRFTGLPLKVGCENYFWVDYGDDAKFMKTINNNIVELYDKDKLENMMQMGYNHMKREHAKGNLPFTQEDFPTPNINDIICEEGLSNFELIKTIGNLVLNSNEMQTLIHVLNSNEMQTLIHDNDIDNYKYINDKNINNNKNNNNKSKTPSKWSLANYEVVEPLAATISSLFSGEETGNIDVSDVFLLTSIVL